MRKTRSWKHNGIKIRKQYELYCKRNEERYQSDFMTLDERYLKGEEDGEQEG